MAVEINSRPERRDPPTRLLELARDLGCLFSIDTDAHAPGQLDLLGYGCERAEAAGIDADRIVNTWPAGAADRLGFSPDRVASRGAQAHRPSRRGPPLPPAAPHRLGLPRRRADRGPDPRARSPARRRPSGSTRWCRRLERSEARRKPSDDELMTPRPPAEPRAPRRPGRPRVGALGRQSAVALGFLHAGDRHHPAVQPAAGDARVGGRLRPGARARAPARARARRRRSGPGWTATRRPSAPRATCSAGPPPPTSSRRAVEDDETLF